MKKRRRTSRKVMIATLATPLILGAAIVLSLVLNWYQQVTAPETLQAIAQEGAYQSQTLVLSLIGVAISVWIGLNLYNVLSKEELKELLDKAEKASQITEAAYTKVLTAKFWLVPSERVEPLLAARLEKLDPLPEKILEQMIAIEDTLHIVYEAYQDGVPTPYSQTGSELCGNLMTYCGTEELSRKQDHFLKGYLALRRGDFLYFDSEHTKKDVAEKDRMADQILEAYSEALDELFGFSRITDCWRPECYKPEERQALAVLANSICSTYLLLKRQPEKEKETWYEAAISAGKVAEEFSGEVSLRARAIFIRNLGVAYQRSGKQDKAFSCYQRSYELDPDNGKTSYCLGSWYRRELSRHDPALPENLELPDEALSTLTQAQREQLAKELERVAYWYEQSQRLGTGAAAGWLLKTVACQTSLVQAPYQAKLARLKAEAAYREEVLSPQK